MNGGDVALDVLCAWTMFLPMGARFSVDALRANLAARREPSAWGNGVAERSDQGDVQREGMSSEVRERPTLDDIFTPRMLR